MKEYGGIFLAHPPRRGVIVRVVILGFFKDHEAATRNAHGVAREENMTFVKIRPRGTIYREADEYASRHKYARH